VLFIHITRLASKEIFSPSNKVQGCWQVLSPTRKETSYSDRRFWFSYILFIIIIGGILVLFIYITRLASKEIFSPSNKVYREGSRAKDLSKLLYRLSTSARQTSSTFKRLDAVHTFTYKTVSVLDILNVFKRRQWTGDLIAHTLLPNKRWPCPRDFVRRQLPTSDCKWTNYDTTWSDGIDMYMISSVRKCCCVTNGVSHRLRHVYTCTYKNVTGLADSINSQAAARCTYFHL
jgi:hypothetical protein